MKQKFQEDFVQPHQVEEIPDKANLFVGSVYQVLDEKHWGFSSDTPTSWHPGACYDFNQSRREAKLVKGTSTEPRKYVNAYTEIQPDSGSGLKNTTYFSRRQLFSFPSKRIELLYHDRLLGKLSDGDLKSILDGLDEFARKEQKR